MRTYLYLLLASLFISGAYAQSFKPLFHQPIPFKGKEVKMIAAWKNKCGTVICLKNIQKDCEKIAEGIDDNWNRMALGSEAELSVNYSAVFHGPSEHSEYGHLRRVVCIATFNLDSDHYELSLDKKRLRGMKKLQEFKANNLSPESTVFFTESKLESFWGRTFGNEVHSLYFLKISKKTEE